MDLQLIQSSQEEARKRFLEYRNAVRARHNAEDEAIMRGYRALAKGSALIDLHETLRRGGQDEEQRPRLAIVRADLAWCHFEFNGGTLRFAGANARDGFAKIQWRSRAVTRIPAGVFERSPNTWPSGVALTPSIPPALRPKHALSNYHILWEAVWQKAPPVDPVLLKHLGGSLYVVLAQWDLTPLEQAVLAGRFKS